MSTTATRPDTNESPAETGDAATGALRRNWSRIWLLVTLISGLIGLTLRLGIVATRDLWADEAFTWRVTLQRFSRMYARVEADFHPPLHYLFVWLLQEGAPDGWGPTYLRVLNLVWFVGLGVVAAWSCRRPSLRIALVPAFAVVAVAPGFVELGAELRMYGMLLALVALLLVAVATIVERPSRSAIVVACIAAPAAAWTHYSGLIAAGAIITAGLVRGGRQRLKSLAPVAAVYFGAGVVALIPFALSQLGHGIGYRITLIRMINSILDDFGWVGLAVVIVAGIFAIRTVMRRGSSHRKPMAEISAISLISAALFALGMLAWWVLKGQIPVNEGVSTVFAYLLLVGVLGLRLIPFRVLIAVLLVVGVVTAGVSVTRLWGAPNYSLGKRVSHVDVLDEVMRQYPPLAADGGRGWLIVEVDWSDMNAYFRQQASERLPFAKVETGTPAEGVVKAKIDQGQGAYQRILVIRRPGTSVVGAIDGYRLEVRNGWTAMYFAEK
ncbi:MAG TPA: hypothetical protein VFP34_13485 [Microlunatus sp.]|nr:hypothetical protein [Microlunatus sp.]